MQKKNYENVVSSVYKHCIGPRETEVKLVVASYANNGTLAVQLLCRPEDCYEDNPSSGDIPFEETYAVITVNLPESERLAVNEQFVDTNNLRGIEEWLTANNIAEPTQHFAHSGYCTYRAFTFHLPDEFLKKVINSREDSIAERLIKVIEASGMKPAEKNERGELYNMPVGSKGSSMGIIIYKGTCPEVFGEKNDIFFLAHHSVKGEQMWRFRNLPKGTRAEITAHIGKAIRRSEESRI